MTTADPKRRLADWFRQWRPPLRKFLLGRARVAVSDVDDVAQEVFLRLMRYEKSELIEHPQAYLFKMASNVAAEWAIKARHAQPHEAKWLMSLVAGDEPEADTIHDEVQREIERAVKTLNPRQREVLSLFFSDGLAQTEIAAKLRETPRSVRRQLAKSYEKLRNELDLDLLGVIRHGRD